MQCLQKNRGSLCRFVLLIGILILSLESRSDAIGFGVPISPVKDICWNCVFPIKVAGVTIIPGDVVDVADTAQFPVCICPAPPPIFFRPGIPVSFWEPARFIETVKDPYYFPSLGIQLPNLNPGFLGGAHSEISAHNQIETSAFAQAHYFVFPVWSVLELLTDFVCVEQSGFDLSYITEVDPLWNNDMLAFAINPEALVFANPAAQMSCMADSVAANAGLPLSALYWCMGSWGSAYPLTGHINDDAYVQANAAIAARMIYKLSRELLICDTGVDLCSCIPTPIWIKQNYRIQIARPVRDFTCHPIGRSSLIWGELKNPPYSAGGNSSDNFLWVIFRKRVCCAG